MFVGMFCLPAFFEGIVYRGFAYYCLVFRYLEKFKKQWFTSLFDASISANY